MQLPDDSHRATEVQHYEGKYFADLVRTRLRKNASTIMLPSNLVLMHQAAT